MEIGSEALCERCQKPYTVKVTWQKWCSKPCKDKAALKRWIERKVQEQINGNSGKSDGEK